MSYIDPNLLVSEGYLQEVNRQFFHPLGLALTVVVEADGTARIAGVLDYRDDPAGVIFDDGVIDIDKAANVACLQHDRRGARLNELGFWMQHLPDLSSGE